MSTRKSKTTMKWSHKLSFGFTLVELVVVITLLAILGTIGFLSTGGYSSRARDSARVGDTAQVSKSLDISIVTAGLYPTPDNSFSVVYSGGIVWNQGTIGNGVLQTLRTSISWGGLNKKPLDPLDNTEYTYSSLAFGKAYQIKVNYEGDLSQTALNLPDFIQESNADPGNPMIAYIRGNYGWLMARTVTGGITYVLAVPSIITNSGSIGTLLSINAGSLSGSLLFNGRSLKNGSSYNPDKVVYSGSTLPTNDSSWAITTMMNNLVTAYSGATDIRSIQNIASLLSTTNTGGLVTLGSTIINNQLGGNTVSGGNTTNLITDTTPPNITSVTAAQIACNTIRFTINGATDAGGLSATPYSFDGGSTWQATTTRDFSGTSYTLTANLVRVRDSSGNIYMHPSSVGGTASSCAVNCSYTTYQWGSCSASCGGGNYGLYYTKTVTESGGGTCSISEGQFASWWGSSCNTQACPTVTYSWVFSNDYGNTYVGGSNPWSMTYYGACGTCSAGNVGSYCSQSWNLWSSGDPDCPSMYCGMRHVCTQSS